MDNKQVSEIFNQMADILEIKQANRFKIIAFRRAGETIKQMPVNVRTIYQSGNLEDIPGVGIALAGKIKELIKTGTCSEFEKLKRKSPEE